MKDLKRTKISDLLQLDDFGKVVNVKGWVRTKRGSKNVSFIALNDGSTIHNIQIVVDHQTIPEKDIQLAHTGASLSVTGEIIESPGSNQKVELNAQQVEVIGVADPDEYPLQPKRHSLEFLREKAHLRFRTNTFGAITRVRHALIFAIHKFFNDKGFYNIHTPIITGSDAEGAGEMFRVTTLDPLKPPTNEDGTVNYKADFGALCELDRDEATTVGALLDRLRATTHGDFRNSFFIDESGNKVYVRLSLEKDDSHGLS